MATKIRDVKGKLLTVLPNNPSDNWNIGSTFLYEGKPYLIKHASIVLGHININLEPIDDRISTNY